MSISVETVKEWFNNTEDELYDMDLPFMSEGDEIELEGLSEGYNMKIVANNTERDYDSYGNRSVDGFIVFSVTGPDGESENFKLPVGYASYEGWGIEIDKIAPTEKKEKVVTFWEWV